MMLKKTIIKICLTAYSKVKLTLKKRVMGNHQTVTTAPIKFFKMKARSPSLMNLRLRPIVCVVPLNNLCDDPDVNKDALFLDSMAKVFEMDTSEIFLSHVRKFQSVYGEARRSMKNRIEDKR